MIILKNTSRMNPIKFYNVERFYKLNKDKILELTHETFSGGQVLEGNYINRTEEELAKLTNRKYTIAVNSCTDALFFSLLAAGIKEGDEILVPAFSFISSASAIIRAGANPIFVDVNTDGLVNLEKAAQKITPKTKAIIPVHIFGRMINPETINSFSEKFNLIVIEDAAQAIGSFNNQIPAGKVGLASCFSFDPSKIIHAFGTGGAVVTDNKEVFDRIRSLRIHGKTEKKNDFEILGYNSRIPSLQASILYFQLLQLSEYIKKRNAIANLYYSKLENIPEIRIINPSPIEIWNYHKFPIFTSYRNDLKSFLKSLDIETGIHYQKTLPEHSLFGNLNESFPVAKELSFTELSLPIYPELNDDEINWICDCIINFYKSKGLC